MSISAGISIRLSECAQPRSAVDIIKVLIDFGWNIIHDGYISYLPFGDKDDFDWQAKRNINFESLIKILESKEQAEETIGIIMTWKNTDIGGTFLFWSKNELDTFSMNITVDRQKTTLTNDYEITDFQWYLPKLLIPLNKVWTVEYFSFDQHI